MSATVSGARTREGLQNLKAGIQQAVAMAVRGAIQATETHAKGTDKYRDRSGATRASTKGRYLGGGRGFVRAGGAMRFLENGHRAFTIRGPLMVFQVGGRTIFTRSVKIPRLKGLHVMRDARRQGEVALSVQAQYYVHHAIQHAR
jgi:hypothetical protein